MLAQDAGHNVGSHIYFFQVKQFATHFFSAGNNDSLIADRVALNNRNSVPYAWPITFLYAKQGDPAFRTPILYLKLQVKEVN